MNMNHCKEFGVSYWVHLRIALWLALVLVVHGIFPMFLDEYVKRWFVNVYGVYPKDANGNVIFRDSQ
jgi:uncharacterized protein YjeT (DUF2065 family)